MQNESEIVAAIETGFDHQGSVDAAALSTAVNYVLDGLDDGSIRVAEKTDGSWQVNQWVKKAVLLSFRLRANVVIEGSHSRFYDKVALKYADYSGEDFARDGVRVVPDAIVRRGAYVAKDVVLMPSYVNIGAYVGSGTLIDTWATVGSCAQIGRTCTSPAASALAAFSNRCRQAHHHRRRLLHRRTFGDCRRVYRRSRVRHFHGRLHRPEHAHIRPGHR